ncbi:SDR family oxidoreductase [Chthonobacter albigriseus]|uniref:SDR family oxidoreductase n=1 Tax=Chthonobacter albigriseus TaxID=1683161 RepID=UPI0015EF6CFA|nr:SDR family oxidoreductase [Chthonobacter albigriseus]
MRFTNSVVVVTGGSTGIGFSAAEAFVAEGAVRVYITGRTADTLQAAAGRLGNRAVPVVADVGTEAGRRALVSAIEANGDRIDVLFANAGIAESRPFAESDESFFDRTFDINVKGVFFTVQSLLPLLNDGGSVVLNASIVGNKGMPNLSVYNASKAAVRSFARSLANDLKPRRIRVNALSPGATLTPIMQNGLKLDQSGIDAFEAMLAANAPAGRMGQPAEIAAGALFLASPAASYVNGIELSVDGGLAQV